MSRFMGWIGGTHPMRYHGRYHTSGLGHIYQQRYKSFPIQDNEHFFVVCRYVERNALRAGLVDQAEQWRWGSLWHWLHKPALQPPLLSPWPIPRLPGWLERVNTPLSKPELAAVRLSAQRGRPLGDPDWVESIASRLNLESTIRPRSRQQIHFPSIKEACPFAFSHVLFTTPYILIESTKNDWTQFLKRTLLKADGNDDRERLYQLLKFGLSKNYWNEFVLTAYHHHQAQAIFLAGIPDQKATLTHA